MMTTVLRKHTKQYHHKSRFTRYLQYFRDVGPSLVVTNCTLDFANSTLGFARAFGENSKLVGGSLFFACSTVFTVFSYYPTTCGLAVSSPSNLQLQLLSQFWGLSLCNFTGRDS